MRSCEEGLGHVCPVDHREHLSERPPAVGPGRIFLIHVGVLPSPLSFVRGGAVASARMGCG